MQRRVIESIRRDVKMIIVVKQDNTALYEGDFSYIARENFQNSVVKHALLKFQCYVKFNCIHLRSDTYPKKYFFLSLLYLSPLSFK